MKKQEINILWLKRDLRLRDHLPLQRAMDEVFPLLIIYCFEPSVIANPQYDVRHWRFVWESLKDFNGQLESFSGKVYVFHSEVLDVFSGLLERFTIRSIFSHEETGLKVTYDRDKAVTKFCKTNKITWQEFQNNGVVRGLRNREGWFENWYKLMVQPIEKADWTKYIPCLLEPEFYEKIRGESLPETFKQPEPAFQPGGESKAFKYLQSFLNSRVKNYSRHISKPAESRRSCSRLSPYIAWGNLSVRQVYQIAKATKKGSPFKFGFKGFMERLRWHCHFIQKFEMEDRMEFESINRGYDALEKNDNRTLLEAWKKGQTGYPLVDACMRCLIATGYINFRMRAMLASFLTHLLWQHWKEGADYLASLFLDFEPGIHYPQFQMQAGVTGINTVRIYNPVKQSLDHDPEGLFIKTWVPELAVISAPLIHQPWNITPLEAKIYHFQPGKDYPQPVVPLEESARVARDKIWGHRKEALVQKERRRILARHTIPRKKRRK